MCGIAAFSKPEGSTTNARHLAHHLLTQIESRGSHASGFAYIDANGDVGMYKNPTPGSQLSLHELPRNARTVVLHTRYATQGHQSDNRNNHPVISTDNRIALVHNGVISNDDQLRPLLGIEPKHGEVDSLVIPSLIAQGGVEALTRLSGYAALAWLDVQNSETLFIARLKNSPVAYTHLYDGTFVMASTPTLLELALLNANLLYGGVFELADGRMIEVENGFIQEHTKAPSMSYDYGSYRRFSSATAGGHSTPAGSMSTTTLRGTEDKPRVFIPGEDDEGPVDIDRFRDDLDAWSARQAERDADDSKIAMAMLTGPKDTWTDEEFEDYIKELEARENHQSCTLGEADSGYGEGFYILDGEGDISHYKTLEELENQLHWLSKMTRHEYDIFPSAADELYWINQIMDMGHIDEDGVLVSWVDDSAEVDEFESPAVHNLRYIREGVQQLATMKGA